MSSFTLYFLVLSATAVITLAIRPLPAQVPSIESQCSDAGHRGACNDINFGLREIRCSQIACKPQLNNPQGLTVAYLRRAQNGTRCADGKICSGGHCVRLPAGRRMPDQVGMNPRFPCNDANVRHH